MKILLDTDACIYIIKNRPPSYRERFSAYGSREVGVSAITVAELEYGAAKSSMPGHNADTLSVFLSPLEVIPFDGKAAQAYGRIRARLESLGQPIGAMDMLIAAQALSLGVLLVTNNIREFSRIEGLHWERWE